MAVPEASPTPPKGVPADFRLQAVVVDPPSNPAGDTKEESAECHKRENDFASDLEDGALLAGGLLAGVAAATNANQYVVLALWVAATGKALPSLLREYRDRAVRRHPDEYSEKDPAHFGNEGTWALDAAGDLLLLTLSTLAALDALASRSGRWWYGGPWLPILLIGGAFVAKAVLDIFEDGYIAGRPAKGGFASVDTSGGSRGTESMLFLVFGLIAIAMAWVHPTGTSTETAYALGLGAIGKALPSLSGSGSGGSKSSGASGSAPKYQVWAAAGTPGPRAP